MVSSYKDYEWKSLTRSGSTTLQTSLAESQTSEAQGQAFSRQLYLDAMAYLIQGLPSDLTDQELSHLQKALPESLKDSTPPKTAQPQLTKRNPSLLHRSLASTIIAICLLLRLALPYIKLFIAVAYNYDRAHHVRERLFAFGITAADLFGRKSMALASLAMTNEVVLGAVTYWVDGIRGGLNEGLGEGLKVIEAQNNPWEDIWRETSEKASHLSDGHKFFESSTSSKDSVSLALSAFQPLSNLHHCQWRKRLFKGKLRQPQWRRSSYTLEAPYHPTKRAPHHKGRYPEPVLALLGCEFPQALPSCLTLPLWVALRRFPPIDLGQVLAMRGYEGLREYIYLVSHLVNRSVFFYPQFWYPVVSTY